MRKDWSVQNCIKERVQKESLEEWAIKNEIPQTPQIKKCDILVANVGWYNLIKNAVKDGLIQFKP